MRPNAVLSNLLTLLSPSGQSSREETHMEPENHWCSWRSSKGPFSGSMLIFPEYVKFPLLSRNKSRPESLQSASPSLSANQNTNEHGRKAAQAPTEAVRSN